MEDKPFWKAPLKISAELFMTMQMNEKVLEFGWICWRRYCSENDTYYSLT